MLFFVPFFLIPLATNGASKPSISSQARDNSIDESNGNIIVLDVVGESKCSDTTRFIVNHLFPVSKKFRSRLRINYHPYGPFKYTSCYQNDHRFLCTCQHGSDECRKNALQACVIEALPDFEDYLPIVNCIQGPASFHISLENCIMSGPFSRRLDRESIVQCANSNKGMKLMDQHGVAARQFAKNVYWVPWISINGLRIPAAERHLEEVLCYQYFEPQPSECQGL